MLLFFLQMSCADKPDGPPPPPTRRNTMDTAAGPAVSGAVESSGRPPKFVRAVCKGGDDGESPMTVDFATSDADGDRVHIRIDWFVNGQRVGGETGPTLAAEHFGAGDKVYAELEATDGYNEVPGECPERTVGNLAPVIDMKGMRIVEIDGLEVKGRDPDGDTLSWRVEDGPSGMSIDSEGVLSWTGSETAAAGSYRPKVIVEDPSGDQAIWEFAVDVAAGREKQKMTRAEAIEAGLIDDDSIPVAPE
ncbi:MAG: hypothetical protein GY913_05345 [Proteobacteria bacterium]|nr:hypothetical protein [Pseudomonadota bacterium]MCP4916327.1 hypothetical protein [Pseudomonadota bacterium]